MQEKPLPRFVSPMLAKRGEAFDSKDHLFEIKWDGVRTLSFVEGGNARLFNRRGVELGDRYPELDYLRDLPPGTVLDGEIVLLRDGKPDFSAMMGREHVRDADRTARLARSEPVTYVVFDLLYRDFESIMPRPLTERREHLGEVVNATPHARWALSESVVESGLQFFEEIQKLELEGMVAKRLDSPYLSGMRTEAWTKIKPVHTLQCVILGYQLDDRGDLKSLIIGAPDDDGQLTCVGKVGSGLSGALRERLLEALRERPCTEPLIECNMEGQWVEPGLFCAVEYLERTSGGGLRAPVFVGLVSE